MVYVKQRSGFYEFILNDQEITESIIINRVAELNKLLKKDSPEIIKILLIAFNTKYDSDDTHFKMNEIFESGLSEFSGIPKKTAIYNHYRDDTKLHFVQFFTDMEQAEQWLLLD